jgi:hypothetical protein
MTFDLNDAELQKSGDLIPDGSYAKVTMIIRPGGVDGESEFDRGLLKRSATPGSDVLSLDCEFTVAEGPHFRRKFWDTLTTSGGKLDENGVSIGAKITKSTLRAMIDSALGLDPGDMSDTTKAKRILRGFADLSGLTFVARIKVEASSNPDYPDRNKLDRAVVPTEPEWRKVMNGEAVPARPSRRRLFELPNTESSPTSVAPQVVPVAPTQTRGQGAAESPASPAGPAWLNS